MTPDDCNIEDGGWFGDGGDILTDVELLKFLFGCHCVLLMYTTVGIVGRTFR